MTSRVFIFVATRSKGLSPLSVLSQRPFSAYLVGVKRNMNERTSEDKTNKSTPQAEAESDLEREHEVEKRRKGRRDLVKKAEQPPQQVSPSLPGTAISVSSPTSAEERAPSLVLMKDENSSKMVVPASLASLDPPPPSSSSKLLESPRFASTSERCS